MINASDARKLTNESDAAIVAMIEKIGKHIESQAKLGKTCVYLDEVDHNEPTFRVKKDPFYPAVFTPVQQLITTRLSSLKFVVKIVSDVTTVGGGLGSMDDERTLAETYHIKVSW